MTLSIFPCCYYVHCMFVLNIMFPSGATRLPADYCFSDLALWKNPTKLVDLVQSGYYYVIKCNLFSSWYRWNIAHFALRNNHLLTPSDTTNCTGGLYNYMTLSIFPCCYYVHCMFVLHIVNHCNCYAPCGSFIGQ
jgi:hypothetical protein